MTKPRTVSGTREPMARFANGRESQLRGAPSRGESWGVHRHGTRVKGASAIVRAANPPCPAGLSALWAPDRRAGSSRITALPSTHVNRYYRSAAVVHDDGGNSDIVFKIGAITKVLAQRTAATIRHGAEVTRFLAERDARLLFGSDTPSAQLHTNPPGLNGRLEMDNWIAAGVSEAKLFRAMTIDNARVMRLDDEIGTIEPGKKANLLLLGADPLKNVQAYDAIETVFLHGRPMTRETLSARHARPGSNGHQSGLAGSGGHGRVAQATTSEPFSVIVSRQLLAAAANVDPWTGPSRLPWGDDAPRGSAVPQKP